MNTTIQKSSKIFDAYLFELVERVTRFVIHIDEIELQFYPKTNPRVSDKLIFLESYRDCLGKIFNMLIGLYKVRNEKSQEVLFENLEVVKRLISQLHKEGLIHLPRPSEPIELHRFSRIIDKQILNLNKANEIKREGVEGRKISIYVSEHDEETFASDPLAPLKGGAVNEAIRDFNMHMRIAGSCLIPEFNVHAEIMNKQTVHVTIPRIDTNNPCRWPTLIHEVGHTVLADNTFFPNQNIQQEFENHLDSSQGVILNEICNRLSGIELRSWLEECWCDLFACLLMGPAFLFSQYSSFLFEPSGTIHSSHPPISFRLTLIYRILSHRFERTLSSEIVETIEICEELLKQIDARDDDGFVNNNDIKQLFLYFKDFFFKHFFSAESSEINDDLGLNPKLKPLVKWSSQINEDIIQNLVKNLENGLPIPSKKIGNREMPSIMQEILLAGWIYRNNRLKNEVLSVFQEFNVDTCIDSLYELYKQKVVPKFLRFDDSILKSIQVSEWFHLYHLEDNPSEPSSISRTEEISDFKGLLVNKEIMSFINSGELKIIPIINLEEQLGSTSFDIRLGTSFQLFYPRQSGMIDFYDENIPQEEITSPEDENSKDVDLDFLESITIAPGQFMLGHSMEYLKLPSNISAEVEGRSSFARLGIEVHMTAGFIEPGYEGVLTFEIFNAGPNSIKLYPGIRIAQIRFFGINAASPLKERKQAKYSGLLRHKYSLHSQDIEVKRIKEEKKKLKG